MARPRPARRMLLAAGRDRFSGCDSQCGKRRLAVRHPLLHPARHLFPAHPRCDRASARLRDDLGRFDRDRPVRSRSDNGRAWTGCRDTVARTGVAGAGAVRGEEAETCATKPAQCAASRIDRGRSTIAALIRKMAPTAARALLSKPRKRQHHGHLDVRRTSAATPPGAAYPSSPPGSAACATSPKIVALCDVSGSGRAGIGLLPAVHPRPREVVDDVARLRSPAI